MQHDSVDLQANFQLFITIGALQSDVRSIKEELKKIDDRFVKIDEKFDKLTHLIIGIALSMATGIVALHFHAFGL